ncbi:MAG: DNA topoisomerase (ATP-hydrolyzing), partial [Planctomycetota bacterium]
MRRIQNVSLAEEARRRYLTYAMSVITARALPDVRDGLKPVQRRILFGMGRDLNLSHQSRFVKSAKVVGHVMGSYHPHGDQAIYDAMVRLAQPFAMRAPLVDGYGNFGSLDGDPPAAFRYTEARLKEISGEALGDLKFDTVEYRPTFDGSGQEPVVLPTKLPLLLLNGAQGIAVGMATSIPPHNLTELCRACRMLIDKRKTTLDELLEVIHGPDLPTGGEVLASPSALRQIYETGRGTLRMRATYRTEREGRRHHIIIDSVPYGVEKAGVIEKMGELIAARKIPQATDIRDESTEDVRIVLEVKSIDLADQVMAYFYRHTALMDTLAFNLVSLTPIGPEGAVQPARLGLKAILTHFLDFRLEVVTRRLKDQLHRLEQRIHILEGFEIIFDELDKAIRIVRRSDGREDAQKKLCTTFGLSQEQATAVLETKIYRLAKLEIEKIREELAAKLKEQKRLTTLLKSEKRRWTLVANELTDMERRFGDARRTKIVQADNAEITYDAEAYIQAEDTHVVVT